MSDRKKMPPPKEYGPVLDHEWDGLYEGDNPVPKWWSRTLWVTVFIGLSYLLLFPSFPGVDGYFKGLLGYSTRAELNETMAKVAEKRAEQDILLEGVSPQEIQENFDLLELARAGGSSAFRVNCSQCHGLGAQGGKGYPNLSDDDWLWGGDLDSIIFTLNNGIRFDDNEDTRLSQMPRFGADGILSQQEIGDIVEHIISLSDQDHDAEAAGRGATLFADNCSSCHGDKGLGDRSQGAPNLADQIWLYGGERAAIRQSITYSRAGVMPAWEHRLDQATIKKLAIYIHSLGGGE